ncbi:phage tail protein I [Mesobacillus thioparans]|uniref:phage tail protein I n=1 Tax=Mesobacillus thioparans TaxID=370439 RepID=UPI0039F12F99
MSKPKIIEVPIDLVQLLPSSLTSDKQTVHLAQAITEEFQRIGKQVHLFDPEKIAKGTFLDLIAWEEHVDFYDSSLPEETKRELVNKSTWFHESKGTPGAIEDLITTVFEEGKVVEWFEYNGSPYTFKVITNNPSVTQEKAAEFIRALDSVKNKRSRLEKVEITQTEKMNLYYGGFVHMGEKMQTKAGDTI